MSTVAMMASTGPPAGSGRNTVTLTISSNTANYNIAANRGPSYIAGETDVVVSINAGIWIYSNRIQTGNPKSESGLQTGQGWTTGDKIIITGAGNIVGCGGTGGIGPSQSGTSGINGTDGIYLDWPITFANFSGIVGGGGGGGGQGGGVYYYNDGSFQSGGYGGKGGDFINSGTGANGNPMNSPGGIGGAPGVIGGNSVTPGAGRAGGAGGGGFGANGGAGAYGSNTYPYLGYTGGQGGQAGYAIRLNGYTVTGSITNYGTIGT